ncbi:MAG: hypothetical protein E7085_02185 [Parabacteroides distasonis]|nr:hypothetical protein [Parabacteroides distasonis]
MDKSLIKRHNFEIEKNKIQEVSKNLPPSPYFRRVEVDGGLFNWGDHKVTGREMNDFVSDVQDEMISINYTFKYVIGAFKDVYKALDYLDKEYIKGILISIEGAEKASKQALSAHEGNKKTIQALQRTVEILKDFKETVTFDLENLKSELTQIKFSSQDFKESCDDIQTIANERNLRDTINAMKDKYILDKAENERRIKIAYFIAGLSVILTIGHFVLQVIGLL